MKQKIKKILSFLFLSLVLSFALVSTSFAAPGDDEGADAAARRAADDDSSILPFSSSPSSSSLSSSSLITQHDPRLVSRVPRQQAQAVATPGTQSRTTGALTSRMYVLSLEEVEGADGRNIGRLANFTSAWSKTCGNDLDGHFTVCPVRRGVC